MTAGPGLSFRARVPVVDANVGVGHRHDRVSPVDSREQLLAELARHGVGRAVVYHLQGETVSPIDANQDLEAWVGDGDALVPQWVLGPTADGLRQLQELHASGRVSSVRLHSTLACGVPFVDWIYGDALTWLSAEGLPLWVSLADTPGTELMATLGAFPDLTTVLLGAHYSTALMVAPLLRRLPASHLELSRYEQIGGVEALVAEFGARRLLYGSYFPRYAMGPVLFYLHCARLAEGELRALCAGTLEGLLRRGGRVR